MCFLSARTRCPSLLPHLAKSWNAKTREVNWEELGSPTFERLLDDLPGASHCLMIPLTSTFNLECREEFPPGKYGRKDVSSEVRARIRLENLFALRMAALAKNLCQNNKPRLIAAPTENEPVSFQVAGIPGYLFSHKCHSDEVGLCSHWVR